MSPYIKSLRCPAFSLLILHLAMSFLPSFIPAAEAACPNPVSSVQAAMIGLRASGDDLEADLTVDPTLSHITVNLRLNESTTLASVTTPVVDGFAHVVMLGALAGSESREIRYQLEATDVFGTHLMKPYPFLVFFDCSGSCDYLLVPGVMTEALAVSQPLHDALNQLSGCELQTHLQTFATGPDQGLRAAAQTLNHQLKLRGLDELPPGCRYDWQAIVPEAVQTWADWSGTDRSVDGSRIVSSFHGYERGAAACFDFQGTGLKDQIESGGFPHPEPGRFLVSTTDVEVSFLCLQGGSECLPIPCEGQVDIFLDYERCLDASATLCNLDSSARTTVAHDFYLDINGSEVLDQNLLEVEVELCRDSPDCDLAPLGDEFIRSDGDAKSDLDLRALAPAKINLVGRTRIEYMSESRRSDGATYSFGMSNFWYEMELIGFDASCTESSEHRTLIRIPERPRPRSGVKMRRWWPDGYGVWESLPPLPPSPPEICRDPPTDR